MINQQLFEQTNHITDAEQLPGYYCNIVERENFLILSTIQHLSLKHFRIAQKNIHIDNKYYVFKNIK